MSMRVAVGARVARPLLAVAIACLAGAAGAPPSGAAPTNATAQRVVYEDARGEDPAGPDITTVEVSNDDAGQLTFRIAIPSHPALTEDLRIAVNLDLDDNRATGLPPAGFDHRIIVDLGTLGFGATGLATCSSRGCGAVGSWQAQADAASLRFSYDAGVAGFALDASKLPQPYRLDPGSGVKKRIWFQVRVDSGIRYDPVTHWDFTNDRWDFAPVATDSPERRDLWLFEWRGPLLVQSFSGRPAPARAGKPFALRLAAVRTDSGAPLTGGTVSCSLSIAGRPLRPRSSGFLARHAVCAFRLPSDAKLRHYRARISVTFVAFPQGTITRSLSGTIR